MREPNSHKVKPLTAKDRIQNSKLSLKEQITPSAALTDRPGHKRSSRDRSESNTDRIFNPTKRNSVSFKLKSEKVNPVRTRNPPKRAATTTITYSLRDPIEDKQKRSKRAFSNAEKYSLREEKDNPVRTRNPPKRALTTGINFSMREPTFSVSLLQDNIVNNYLLTECWDQLEALASLPECEAE